MKAAVFSEYGDSKVISVVDNIDKPVNSEGHVVVEIRSAGINPFDYKVMSGAMKDHVQLKFPKVIGMDFAGVVSEASPGGSGLKVGDEVFGQADFFGGGGSTAEYSIAKLSSISPKPANINFDKAAAIPLVAASAYQVIIEKMNLASGQKILVIGGAGGIGSIAVQLAKHIGAYVASTCRTEDIDFVKNLGADEVISFEIEDFDNVLRDFDCVFDVIGGDIYKMALNVLKPNGVIVSMVQNPEEIPSDKPVKAIHQSTDVNSKALAKVSELLSQGAFKPKVAKVFSIDETAAAFEMLMNAHPQGKVIVKIKD